MLRQNHNLKSKIAACRKIFVLTIVGIVLAVWSSVNFLSEAAAVNLNVLKFYYLNDGSIKIEFVCDKPEINYQIQRAADKTIIQIKNVNSKLHPSYLVRNAFNVEIKTAIANFDNEPGAEIIILTPSGTSITPFKENNKIFFLAGFDYRPKATAQQFSSGLKNTPVKQFQKTNGSQIVSNNKTSLVPTEDEPQLQTQIRQGSGAISGYVKDELGGVIVGAEVIITDQNGRQRIEKTNQDGFYRFTNLPPGKYVLKVNASNFAQFESKKIESENKPFVLPDIVLKVNLETQVVTIDTEKSLNTDPGNNANGIVLRETGLNLLPDDPQGLANALQGLSAASGNQLGAQIIVDGFSGGKVPPKKSIKEIRINKNPYSAEFNRPGNGRIEIITKPGMQEFSGGGFFGFNNNILNTRNPFADVSLPYQSNDYGFYLGGPIKPKRISFFFNFERGNTKSNNLINGQILDSNLNTVRYNKSVLSPSSYLNVTPRVDLKLDDNNTLSGRYFYSVSSSENAGVGGFSLLSAAYRTKQTEQSMQLSETAVVNPRLVTETRSQFVRRINRREPNFFGLTVNVPGAFTSGASFQQSFSEYRKAEAGNITTLTLPNHTIRTGGGIQYVEIKDFSLQNSGGAYRFEGGFAPLLNNSNEIIYDTNGNPIIVPVSGLERFRRTNFFSQLGKTPKEIRELGGGATQFTISEGNRQASVNQYSVNAFVQDDWRLRPNFTLALGMRFEAQTNINKNLNFAPRISFAWSKNYREKKSGAGNKNKETMNFVLRGGIGLFYEEFGGNFTLRVNRFNGLNQHRYIVTDSAILDLFPQIPAEELLRQSFSLPTIVSTDSNLRSPLSIQSSISFEKQLPFKLVLSTNYLNVKTINALRSRYFSDSTDGATKRIFQYESTGKFNQNQLSFTLSRRLSKSSFYATYTLSKADSNTDGADFIPFLDNDYGRASTNVRHTFYFGSWFRTFGGVDINPVVYYRSGVSFDITLGRDLNGDSILNDRPTFATDLNRPSVVITPYGAFDLEPISGQSIIPRNYAVSPDFLSANLNISKTFTFFNDTKSTAKNDKFDLWGIQVPKQKFYLTFSMQIENVFNWTNPYLPEGNLSSPLFGQSYFSAGNYGFGINTIGNRVVKPYIVFSF